MTRGGAVDDGRRPGHRALLGERVAVVGGHRVVGVGEVGQVVPGPGRVMGVVLTVRADPGKGEVADVQREAVAVGQLGGEAAHQLGGQLHDRAALVAHQVEVLVLVGRVGGRAVAEVGVADEADASSRSSVR